MTETAFVHPDADHTLPTNPPGSMVSRAIHDPAPPGKVAMWMFLASELMFFVAILGTYVILRAGQPDVFKKFSAALSIPLAGANTLILISSSLTMALAVNASKKADRSKTIIMLLLTLTFACAFLAIKGFEYRDKWNHHTIVYRDSASPSGFSVVDGHLSASKSSDEMTVLRGVRMAMPTQGEFDIHLIGQADFNAGVVTRSADPHKILTVPFGRSGILDTGPGEAEVSIQRSAIAQDLNYLPWKNAFFACYFTLTGLHGLHIIGGMAPLFVLLVQAIRGRMHPAAAEYVGLYWHFVDLVWIFLFPLFYLI